MCNDDFYEDGVFVEYNFMQWLVSELKDMRVDVRMIARVKDKVEIMEESVVEVE